MPGYLLSDREIEGIIKDKSLKVSGLVPSDIDLSSPNCTIQPSSLDLHIGKIFIPPDTPLDLSNTEDNYPVGETGYQLPAGHSVIVETKEEIELSGNLSAFGFPPAHFTRGGLLMTNLGHIDPGYRGKLTFTIINMGRCANSLKINDAIVTLLIFEFASDVAVDYRKRIPGLSKRKSTLKSTLNDLAKDFANFDARAKGIAIEEVKRQRLELEIRKVYIPALITILGAMMLFLIGDATNIISFASTDFVEEKIEDSGNRMDGQLARIDAELSVLKAKSRSLTLDQRLNSIERKLEELQTKER